MLFAYLDPGSGSALVGTLFAVIGAGLFSLKGIVYKLLRKEVNTGAKKNTRIVIFSEGKNYWGTWQGIVEELIHQEINFCYYTLDLYDPALRINSPYMYARLFDKEKASSFVRLSKIEADVCLSTTPNIGTEGYPIKRSSGIKNLVHVFHAYAPATFYRKGSLNHYDTVLTAGAYQEDTLREIERTGNLPEKKLIVTGLPYFDDMLKRLQKFQGSEKRYEKKIVMVAPSWGPICCLRHYGINFVLELAKVGYHVIVRPHPQSHISDKELVAEWRKSTAGVENIEWDERVSPLETMRIADVLISDMSSVRLDFAFLFSKPVVTLITPEEARDVKMQYEVGYIKTDWMRDVSDKIGKVITTEAQDKIVETVNELVKMSLGDELKKFRNETIANIGVSSAKIVDELIRMSK